MVTEENEETSLQREIDVTLHETDNSSLVTQVNKC